MLRQRLLPILLLATVMGLVTSYLVYRGMQARTDPNQGTAELAVAAANVNIGEALTAQHVKMTRWPVASIPPQALTSLKAAEGRVAKVSLIPGEPLLEAKLAPPGQGGLMPVMVPAGKRAVTIKLDEAAQKSGFLLPNSRVDVLVTMAKKAGESKISRVVLQDVTVLAADQTVETKDNRPVTMTTVTLALTPAESERLALAQNEGKVTMAIRNLADASRVSTPGVTTAQFLDGPASPQTKAVATGSRAKPAGKAPRASPPPAPAEPPAVAAVPAPPAPAPRHSVAVIRGVTVTQQVFVRDQQKGWVESPGESGAKAQPKP
jgi:pilus assembly protein CpaB